MTLRLSRTMPARRLDLKADWCHADFCVMSPEFRRIRSRARNKMDKCFWCKHDFVDGEMMALACFQDKGNRTLCQKCAAELKRSGDS